MIVGLVGLLSGYDGKYDFGSGEAYPASVPYVAMRVMLATFGVALVPLGWYTAVELGMSWMACHLVALMVLCGEHSFGEYMRAYTVLIPFAQMWHGCAYLDSFFWTQCCCSSRSLLFTV